MRASSSQLDLYYDWCQRKYLLKYIEKIKSQVFQLGASLGTLCHKEIKLFWKTYKLDITTYSYDLQKYYNNRVNYVRNLDLGDDMYIGFQICFNNFIQFQERRIEKYIEKYGNDFYKVNNYFFPVLVEEYGIIKITKNLEFSFVIDALFQVDTNENEYDKYLLIDWKTDKDCNESQFNSHKPQLNRYAKCVPVVFGYQCHFIGVYFLKESKFFSGTPEVNYSIEDIVKKFVRDLQISKFDKVDKKDNWKCCSKTYQCEYYPDPCNGNL